jgi:hypothetical protein
MFIVFTIIHTKTEAFGNLLLELPDKIPCPESWSKQIGAQLFTTSLCKHLFDFANFLRRYSLNVAQSALSVVHKWRYNTTQSAQYESAVPHLLFCVIHIIWGQDRHTSHVPFRFFGLFIIFVLSTGWNCLDWCCTLSKEMSTELPLTESRPQWECLEYARRICMYCTSEGQK